MLTLHTLKPSKGSKKNRKRLGRGVGSGHGDTSGRGHKGQKARKSGNPPPGFEGGQTPLYRRLPKRGFNNIFRKQYIVVNVGLLENIDLDEINLENLKKAGVVKGKANLLKILGDGELSKPLTIKAHKFTKTAEEKITKAGGKLEVIDG